MQLAQEQRMVIYSSPLPENLLKELLQNLERRFILVELLMVECLLSLPPSAALPKWVTYSQETFGSSAALLLSVI